MAQVDSASVKLQCLLGGGVTSRFMANQTAGDGERGGDFVQLSLEIWTLRKNDKIPTQSEEAARTFLEVYFDRTPLN